MVSVEGATLGWDRYADVTVGLDRFGASPLGDVVQERLGFTPQRVAEEAARLVARRTKKRRNDVTIA